MPSNAENYVVEVDKVDKDLWHENLSQFDDANIYQTWSYDAVRRGEDKLSHLVLRQDGEVSAAAQIVILRMPLIRAGIAHVKFGPLWRRSGLPRDAENYRRILRALRDEYVDRRGLLLRMKPWEVAPEELREIRETEGFSVAPNADLYETFVIDLSYSQEEHHKGLKRKWRHELKHALNSGLEFTELEGTEGLDCFLELYDEMTARKKFADFTDIRHLREIFSSLPPWGRPSVLACRRDGAVMAAIVCSVVGDFALALYGATSAAGRKCRASYFLNWQVANWLRDRGDCRWYDLVGGTVDPGVRLFKTGLVGRCGELHRMPDFDLSGSILNRLLVDTADRLRHANWRRRG